MFRPSEGSGLSWLIVCAWFSALCWSIADCIPSVISDLADGYQKDFLLQKAESLSGELLHLLEVSAYRHYPAGHAQLREEEYCTQLKMEWKWFHQAGPDIEDENPGMTLCYQILGLEIHSLQGMVSNLLFQ